MNWLNKCGWQLEVDNLTARRHIDNTVLSLLPSSPLSESCCWCKVPPSGRCSSAVCGKNGIVYGYLVLKGSAAGKAIPNNTICHPRPAIYGDNLITLNIGLVWPLRYPARKTPSDQEYYVFILRVCQGCEWALVRQPACEDVLMHSGCNGVGSLFFILDKAIHGGGSWNGIRGSSHWSMVTFRFVSVIWRHW